MTRSGRVLERLDRIYAIGGGPGANRPAFSREEDEAHELVAAWMREAGLEVEVDAARNLFGRLRGTRPELSEAWSGSHLDSVPQGGRFDGPLGVLAALEAVERLGPQERTLAVVAFRDEEGSRFGRGCFGSRALAGQLEDGELDTRDDRGVALRDLVECETGGWLERKPHAFLEVHVEQGPVLAAQDAPVGIVTSIVGLARLEVALEGAAGHAGTTPMPARADALVAAANLVLRVRDAALAHPGSVATVGRLSVEPNAANVIPAAVHLTIDARAPEDGTLASLLDAIGTGTLLRRTTPAPMAAEARAALRAAAEELDLPVVELHSGAGHDAGVMASAGVPSGMLFVRSRNGGISHSPDEHSDDEDVAVAVDVLEGALRRLAAA